MANTKNETGKPAENKQSAGDTGGGGKVSAGTSVGNIGEPPMPHVQGGTQGAAAQASSSQASSSAGGQGSDRSKGEAQRSGAQGQQAGSMSDKAQQAAEQVRQRAEDAYEEASDWARDTYERASDWASRSYEPRRRQMRRMRGRSAKAFGDMRGQAQDYISENPMVVGLVGLATGLLIGALLPRTRRENKMFGEWADEMRQQGVRYARDAAKRGREYVEENFSGEEPRFSRHESEFESGRPDSSRH